MAYAKEITVNFTAFLFKNFGVEMGGDCECRLRIFDTHTRKLKYTFAHSTVLTVADNECHVKCSSQLI